MQVDAQTAAYNQLTGEFQFSHTFRQKWVIEVDLGGAFSNTPNENKILKTFIQKSARCWLHHQLTPRWKLSAFIAFFDNKDVPEIGQYKSPEWRWALQGTYYIHKIGYTLTTRLRGEYRLIKNEKGVFADQLRYRHQLKYLQPLNSKALRKNVIYVIGSDEVFFRSKVKSKGLNFFDRNRLTIGGGYMITDDLQVELVYVNEYLPRDNENQLYHALSLTVSINNLIPFISQKLERRTPVTETND